MEAKKLFSRFRIDLLLISATTDIKKRLSQISEKFNLKGEMVSSLEEYEQGFSDIGRPIIAVIDLVGLPKDQSLLKLYALQSFLPKSEIVALVKEEDFKTLSGPFREAGVHYVLTDKEVTGTVRMDFLLLHRLLLDYLPIDLNDLFPGTTINFNAFHFLKLNNRFLPVVFEDFVLSDKKFKRLEKIKKIFIRKEDSSEYQKYIETYYDLFKIGLQKRLRASFFQILVTYGEIRSLLIAPDDTDRKERFGFLMKDCEEMFKKLGEYLKNAPEPLFAYSQAYSQNLFFGFDRSVLVAGFAAFLAEMSGLADPLQVLRAGILAPSGLFSMDYSSYLKWLERPPAMWEASDERHFANALVSSIEVSKKYYDGFDENIEKIIGSLFEKHNGEGYPNNLSGDQIPAATHLLNISEVWFRKVASAGVDTADQAYESFKQCLIEEQGFGKINPDIINQIQSLGFVKAHP